MKENQTILIIEDNDSFRSHLVEILTAQGYKVLEASNGEIGWNYVQHNPVDIVILDMIMPGKNGSWFVDCVRDNKEYKDLPIIIFTNLSHGENIGKVITKGISRMLIKESTSDSSLVQEIKDVLATG